MCIEIHIYIPETTDSALNSKHRELRNSLVKFKWVVGVNM